MQSKRSNVVGPLRSLVTLMQVKQRLLKNFSFWWLIQMAGAVRGRRNDRNTTSDFLKVEQERVSLSVVQ